MNKFLSFRGGLVIVAVAAFVALGVAYAVQIQRGVTGAVIIGRVQTAEETLLLYSEPPPRTVDLTQLTFGTVDINAFGLFTVPPRIPAWIGNGGDLPFGVRVQVVDVEINDVPVSGDILAVSLRSVGPVPTPTPPPPTPTATTVPPATAAPTATPVPPATPEPTATPVPAPVPTATPAQQGSATGPFVEVLGFDSLPLVTPTLAPTPTPAPTPIPTATPHPPPPPGTPLILPGELYEFEVSLRFLSTPGDLGIDTGDRITFTALFVADGFIPPPTPTPTPTPTPRPGTIEPRVNRLVVAIAPRLESNLPWTLPTSYLIQLRPALEHLIGIDRATGEYVSELAASWDLSQDGLAWTFGLRQGVQFHDGWGALTARDVVHSLDMIMTADSRAGNAQFWRDTLTRAEIIDDATVRLHLNRPEPELYDYISANRDLLILSKAFWDAQGLGGYEDRVVGTGSYDFTDRVVAQHILYSRVTDHWRRTPDFPELQLLFEADGATRMAALLTGRAHMAELSRDVHGEAEAGGMRVVPSRLPGIQVAWFIGGQYYPSSPNAPFDDARVRRAINHAIDRDAINEIAFGGRGELMSVFGFHPSLPGWGGWQPYPYDPDLARQLLADAGYAGGFDVTLYTASLSSLPEISVITRIIADNLNSMGISPTIQVIEFSTLRQLYVDRQMHGALWGLPVSRLHPRDTIRFFNVSSGIVHSYEDPRIEELYAALQGESDFAGRVRYLVEIGSIKHGAYAEIPLLWLPADFVVNPDIVADYVFPGTVSGFLSHLEYVAPVPR